MIIWNPCSQLGLVHALPILNLRGLRHANTDFLVGIFAPHMPWDVDTGSAARSQPVPSHRAGGAHADGSDTDADPLDIPNNPDSPDCSSRLNREHAAFLTRILKREGSRRRRRRR